MAAEGPVAMIPKLAGFNIVSALLSNIDDTSVPHPDPSSGSVVLSFPDVNGVLRGKAFTPKAFEGIRRRNSAVFTNLLLALDPLDVPITAFETFGIASGAADLIVRPDQTTMRKLPWSRGRELCLGDLYWDDGSACELSTRGVLKTALGRLERHGLTTLASFEFEVRVFTGTYGAAATDGLSYGVSALTPLDGFIADIRQSCDELGLGLAAVHTEGAPGLLEINLEPGAGMAAADNAALLRLALKELGRARGLHVSFMSKPVEGQEGSSGHLHCSLVTADGKNAFAEAAPHGSVSPLMRQAVGGVVKHLPAMSLLCNPTINSYKRLVPGFFAPVNASWGIDNRSAAVRVIFPEHGDGTRLELRRPGADVNPYLGLAALVNSICLGIENDLSPPPPMGRMDAGAASVDQAAPLPASLEQAIGAFLADVEARATFGDAFSDYFVRTRQWELSAWQKSVSDWERTRYLQIT